MDRLMEAEVNHYREHGYVAPAFTLAQKPMTLIERRLGRLLNDNPELSPTYIGDLLERDVSWISIARQPQILDTVEQLIGSDFLLWEAALHTVPPNSAEAPPWRQDGEIWPIRPLATCTVSIAVDALTTGNGGLRFVPGSHKAQQHAHHMTAMAEDAYPRRILRDQAEADAHGKDLVLKRAQIAVHDVYTVYGAYPNTTSTPSRRLTFRFMPTTSHFDHDLAAIQIQQEGAEDLSGRHLHLMRGSDISRRNNFNVGRQSSTVSVNVGSVH